MSETNPDGGQSLDIEKIASGIDFRALFEDETDRRQVNFWISEEHQERFHALQRRTRKRFGRKLIELIELCVDLAESADPKNEGKSA